MPPRSRSRPAPGLIRQRSTCRELQHGRRSWEGHSLRWLSAIRGKQCPDARIAQIEPGPQEDAQIDAEKCVTEERATDARMRGDGAAEIARQEHSPERACSRPAVEEGAHEQQDAERRDGVRWPAELNRRLEHDWQPHQFHRSIHQQEKDDEATERVANAKLPCWGGRDRAGVDHVCFLPLV